MVDPQKLRVDFDKVLEIAASDPAGLIALSEERYCAQVRQAADWFLTGVSSNIIMLAGPSSSGKTTTSQNLQREMARRGVRTETVSLDDFFMDISEVPPRADGTRDYDTPEVVDLDELESCLDVLMKTGECLFPVYDFAAGRRAEEGRLLHFDDHTAIIVEGLHALNPAVCGRDVFRGAMKLYISIKTEYYRGDLRILSTREARLIRRLVRDVHFRATPPRRTFEMWSDVVAGEDLYIRPYRTQADMWIDSLHLYEPLILGPLVTELLLPLTDDPEWGSISRRLTEAVSSVCALDASVPADSLLREFLPPASAKGDFLCTKQ